jgi:hypothetical protein
LTFSPPEKLVPSLITVGVAKKIFLSCPQRVSKEAEFCVDFKQVENSCVKQKGKKFPKTDF